MTSTENIFKELYDQMKEGASRTDACRNLGIAIHKTYHVLSKKENTALKNLTKKHRDLKNEAKFKKAEELIMQGVPFYKAMEQTNINVTTLTSKRIKYLRALKEIKDRKSEDKLQEQFEKVVNCLMEGHPISAIGVMVGISMPLFMDKLTNDQKSVIQELRELNKMNNSTRGTYQKKREDEKVKQLTAEEKEMLYNGELQICYSDLKNASSIIADVFPEDTTISFFESATNFLTGWKLGMWKTDNMAFENVKVVEV